MKISKPWKYVAAAVCGFTLSAPLIFNIAADYGHLFDFGTTFLATAKAMTAVVPPWITPASAFVAGILAPAFAFTSSNRYG